VATTRPLDHIKRASARRLRQRATPAEVRFWKALERLPIDGSHFRRQVPIGPYVVDFACLSVRLVVELDGGHHGEPEQSRRDAARTAWLEAEGYRVLRFWNDEVQSNVNGVLDTIYAALHGSLAAVSAIDSDRLSPRPHPTPSLRDDPPPRGEGDPSPVAGRRPSDIG
jgi:very-short-patch-repair endonuclease